MGKMAKNCLSPLVGQIVSPGDPVLELPDDARAVVRLGGGLQQDGETVIATKAGMLRYAQPGRYWVESSQKRYIPQVEDVVVGCVINKMGENFEVDINGPCRAILSMMSFEGATRRNRPNVKVGSLVYARVVAADRDLEPELSCVDAHGKSSGFGPLLEGYKVDCTTGLARKLLSNPPCPVLVALGQEISYEIAVGLNGRAWVHSPDPATTILVANAILNSEFITAQQSEIMVKALLQMRLMA